MRFTNPPALLMDRALNLGIHDMFKFEPTAPRERRPSHPNSSIEGSQLVAAWGNPVRLDGSWNFPITIEVIPARYEIGFYAVFHNMHREHQHFGWVIRFGPFKLLKDTERFVQDYMADQNRFWASREELGWDNLWHDDEPVRLLGETLVNDLEDKVMWSTSVFSLEQVARMEKFQIMLALVAVPGPDGFWYEERKFRSMFEDFGDMLGSEVQKKHFGEILVKNSETAEKMRNRSVEDYPPDCIY